MQRNVGLWINHNRAFIVSVSGEKEWHRIIESKVEGRIRLSGGSRSRTIYGPQDVISEKKSLERRKHQLHQYYREVTKAIGDAKKILIFGPGEAKGELEKEIKKRKDLSVTIVGVESADQMTDKQIVAKVRKFFSPIS